MSEAAHALETFSDEHGRHYRCTRCQLITDDPFPREPCVEGVWISYFDDWSGVSAFASEIDAMRHAVEHGCRVAFAPWGQTFGPGCMVVEGLVGGP